METRLIFLFFGLFTLIARRLLGRILRRRSFVRAILPWLNGSSIIGCYTKYYCVYFTFSSERLRITNMKQFLDHISFHAQTYAHANINTLTFWLFSKTFILNI